MQGEEEDGCEGQVESRPGFHSRFCSLLGLSFPLDPTIGTSLTVATISTEAFPYSPQQRVQHQNDSHDRKVFPEAPVLCIGVVDLSSGNPAWLQKVLVLLIRRVTRLRDIIDGLEHQNGDGEEDQVVEVVLRGVPL